MQVLVLRDDLKSKWMNFLIAIPKEFKLTQLLINKVYHDKNYVAHILLVTPVDRLLGGGFLHMVFYEKKPNIELDRKDHRGSCEFRIMNLGNANTLIAFSFV